jgi:hypothetical protein
MVLYDVVVRALDCPRSTQFTTELKERIASLCPLPTAPLILRTDAAATALTEREEGRFLAAQARLTHRSTVAIVPRRLPAPLDCWRLWMRQGRGRTRTRRPRASSSRVCQGTCVGGLGWYFIGSWKVQHDSTSGSNRGVAFAYRDFFAVFSTSTVRKRRSPDRKKKGKRHRLQQKKQIMQPPLIAKSLSS